MKRFILCWITIAIALPVKRVDAESAADALLRSVTPGTSEGTKTGGAPKSNSLSGRQVTGESPFDIRLNDEFLKELYREWSIQKRLPFDVNHWILSILKNDFEAAAHLWTVIEPQIPSSLTTTAAAARIYLLWKLELPQTFFDAWVERLSDKGFMKSKIAQALDVTLSPLFDRWMIEHAPTISLEQKRAIRGLQDSTSQLSSTIPTLKAVVALRSGDAAVTVLKILPDQHAFKVALAHTAALALAKKNNMAGAATILKTYAEPALDSQKDPREHSAYVIEIARLLYQAGSYDGAESFYEKIPNGAPQFLDAREELLWVWLRKGDSQKLRGELTSLSHDLFTKIFAPEVYLVRAISNLKLCYYSEVKKDFDHFLSHNSKWAKTIDSALTSAVPPAPSQKDFFMRLAETAFQERTQEATRLAALGERSIVAVLPAVGPQIHWTKAQEKLRGTIEAARKEQEKEYHRQWKNQQLQLTEAIRKMQFVKVELLSQLHYMAKKDPDGVVISKNPEKLHVSQTGVQSFPFDGLLWPDEMFHLRGVTQGHCLQAKEK